MSETKTITDRAIEDERRISKEKGRDDFAYYFQMTGRLAVTARELEALADELAGAMEKTKPHLDPYFPDVRQVLLSIDAALARYAAAKEGKQP